MANDETPAELELFSEVANGLAGKLTEGVILLQTGDPMLAAAMGGGAGGATKGLVVVAGRRLLLRRREKLEQAFTAAELESGQTPQELFEHALDQDDERRLDLFVSAFSAAAREVDERKVRAFGRMAASGVLAEDDAKVDETARVFTTLAALDEVDLKVLLHITADPEVVPWHLTRRHRDQVLPLDEELPELIVVLEPVLTRLESLGLVTSNFTPRTVGGRAVVVTAFARLCVRELLCGVRR